MKNKMKELPLIINTQKRTIQLLEDVSLKELVEYCAANTIDLEVYKILATKIELKFSTNNNPILGDQPYRELPVNHFQKYPNTIEPVIRYKTNNTLK